MSKKGWAVGAIAFFAIVGSCNNSEQPSTTTPSSTASASAPSSAAASPAYSAPITAAAPTTPVQPAGVTVTRVIDGDTFEIAGGQRVRVLGIDSCEMSTYGGKQARSTAETYLDGEQVVLEREPGVDKDKNGRLLRYVTTSYGNDFGETMVGYNHTGVYQGKNDASKQRLADLRERDHDGRDCSEPDYTPSTSSGDVDVDVDGGGDINIPDGALTGGYCARKWWC